MVLVQIALASAYITLHDTQLQLLTWMTHKTGSNWVTVAIINTAQLQLQYNDHMNDLGECQMNVYTCAAQWPGPKLLIFDVLVLEISQGLPSIL